MNRFTGWYVVNSPAPHSNFSHPSRRFLYFSGRVAGDLKVSCEKTVQLFQNAQMNKEIQVVLRNQMEKTFGTEGFNDTLFAVRSSAAGNFLVKKCS